MVKRWNIDTAQKMERGYLRNVWEINYIGLDLTPNLVGMETSKIFNMKSFPVAFREGFAQQGLASALAGLWLHSSCP